MRFITTFVQVGIRITSVNIVKCKVMTVLGRPRDCTNQPKSNVWGLLLSHSIFESKIGQAGPPLFFSPYNPLNAFHVSVNFDLEIVVASEL